MKAKKIWQCQCHIRWFIRQSMDQIYRIRRQHRHGIQIIQHITFHIIRIINFWTVHRHHLAPDRTVFWTPIQRRHHFTMPITCWAIMHLAPIGVMIITIYLHRIPNFSRMELHRQHRCIWAQQSTATTVRIVQMQTPIICKMVCKIFHHRRRLLWILRAAMLCPVQASDQMVTTVLYAAAILHLVWRRTITSHDQNHHTIGWKKRRTQTNPIQVCSSIQRCLQFYMFLWVLNLTRTNEEDNYVKFLNLSNVRSYYRNHPYDVSISYSFNWYFLTQFQYNIKLWMIYDLCLFFFLVIVILFISFRHKIHELFRFS